MVGSLRALLCASLMACSAFDGAPQPGDTGEGVADASAPPDARVAAPPDAGIASPDASDSCPQGHFCDDFERLDVAANGWTVDTFLGNGASGEQSSVALDTRSSASGARSFEALVPSFLSSRSASISRPAPATSTFTFAFKLKYRLQAPDELKILELDAGQGDTVYLELTMGSMRLVETKGGSRVIAQTELQPIPALDSWRAYAIRFTPGGAALSLDGSEVSRMTYTLAHAAFARLAIGLPLVNGPHNADEAWFDAIDIGPL